MIQLFLTLLLLIILIIILIIIRTKESFYQTCLTNNLVLNAKNDIDDTNKLCIKLIPNNVISIDRGGYILIKTKNANISKVINIESHMMEGNEIKLTQGDHDIILEETYLITLNIMHDDNELKVYNTVAITFRDITLSDDDLNTKCKSSKDKLIESLKTKNIVLSL
jgi:hypothetical protein